MTPQAFGALITPDHIDMRESAVGYLISPQFEKLWIPITQFLGLEVGGGPPEVWRSAGEGNPTITELGSTGLVGGKILAVGNDFRTLFPIPDKWDCRQDSHLSVVWSSDQITTTDTVTWKALYDALTIDVSAVAAGTTALDTAIAADANAAVANAYQETPKGVINGGSLTNGTLLSLLIEADAMSGADPSTDVIMVYGVMFYYRRLWL